MHTVMAVTKKELRAYFNSPNAYIFLVIFGVLSAFLFFQGFVTAPSASVRSLFGNLPTLFFFLLPALTMRVWAEEKRAGTDELLLTLPLTQGGIVLGKYLASFILLALGLLITLPTPITVWLYGNSFDWGPVIGGYLGAAFLGGAYLSIGLVISAFTKNQLVALILSVIVCFFFYVLGSSLVLDYVPESLAAFFQTMALSTRFVSIERGVIDFRDVLYYATFIGFFLFLNVIALRMRPWK